MVRQQERRLQAHARIVIPAAVIVAMAMLTFALALAKQFAWRGLGVTVTALLLAVVALAWSLWTDVVHPERSRRRATVERSRALHSEGVRATYFWPPKEVLQVTNTELFRFTVHTPSIPTDTPSDDEMQFPYSKRAKVDDALARRLAALASQSGVLSVVGPAVSGKSRSLWEALRSAMPTRRISVVAHPDYSGSIDAIASTIETSRAWASESGEGPIILVEDAHNHIHLGHLNAVSYDALLTIHPKTVVIFTADIEKLGRLGQRGQGIAARLVDGAIVVHSDLDDDDIRIAIRTYPSLAANPRIRQLPALLSGVTAWIELYNGLSNDTARTIIGALAGWKHIGMEARVSRETLHDLVKDMSPRRLSGARFDQALALVAEPSEDLPHWYPTLVETAGDHASPTYEILSPFLYALLATGWTVPAEIGRLAETLVANRDYVDADPVDVAQALAVASYYLERGDRDTSVRILEETAGRVPFEFRDLIVQVLATLHAEAGEVQRAERYYRLVFNPERCAAAGYALGALLADIGDDEKSIEVYGQVVTMNDRSSSPMAANNVGIMFMNRGEFDRAEQSYQISMKFDHPDASPRAARNLGAMLAERSEDNERALGAYEFALKYPHPEVRAIAANDMGVLYKRLGRLGDAKRSYQMAIDGDVPEAKARGWQNLGSLLEEEGDPKAAVEAYEAAMNVEYPEVASDSAASAAVVYVDLREYNTAAGRAGIAIASGFSRAVAHGWFALAKLRQLEQDPVGALAALVSAVAAGDAKWSPHAACGAAMMYEAHGDLLAAISFWRVGALSSSDTDRATSIQALRRLGVA